MEPDLQGLAIRRGELRRWSGTSINAVLMPPTMKKFLTEILKTCALVPLLFLSCLVQARIFLDFTPFLVILHVAIAFGLVVRDAKKIYFTKKNYNLVRLFEEVDRYNAVIKAIDLNDRIESAGNPSVKLQDRDRVIDALYLTREDLIRALKTERILRENENFIQLNQQLFDSNLSALAALQVSDRASEHGRLLNEAIQIAVDVQQEMRKLKP
jgi:hypothetical protein